MTIFVTYSLLPTPYSLLPTPYSLLPTPYSLLPTPYSLFPIPFAIAPYSHSLGESWKRHFHPHCSNYYCPKFRSSRLVSVVSASHS
ncbi:MAG: hypothetical protein F6K56_22340 [Moorea sp. SIO3G5]|nr:hypothetical protein [Moorena sp. SIO3G5]